MCAFLGDKAAVSSNWQFYTARGMAWTKASLDAYRDMDMAFIGGLYWRSFLATGTQGVTFILPEQEIRYFSGAKVDRRLNRLDLRRFLDRPHLFDDIGCGDKARALVLRQCPYNGRHLLKGGVRQVRCLESDLLATEPA